jgi:hypothetical protein
MSSAAKPSLGELKKKKKNFKNNYKVAGSEPASVASWAGLYKNKKKKTE